MQAGYFLSIPGRRAGYFLPNREFPGQPQDARMLPGGLIFITGANEEQQLLVYWNRGFMKTGRLTMQKRFPQDKAS